MSELLVIKVEFLPTPESTTTMLTAREPRDFMPAEGTVNALSVNFFTELYLLITLKTQN